MQRCNDVTPVSFFLRLGHGFCRDGFGFCLCPGGFWRGGIFYGGVLVFFAAVIGDVKSAALEKQSAAAADFLFYFSAPPFFLRAGIFGQICKDFADMDWTDSNSCPHFSQMYS